MIDVRPLQGAALEAALEDVAALRIAVFRDWPYLFDGALDYERAYLATYRDNPGALLVGAYDGDRLIGASTSTRMEDHAAAFAAPLTQRGFLPETILYGAESLILPEWRGQGLGHRFIVLREEHALNLGRSHVAFCSVQRPYDHPLRPANARTNDAFWRRHGYAPVPGVVAEFGWTDIGGVGETLKRLQFWMRRVTD